MTAAFIALLVSSVSLLIIVIWLVFSSKNKKPQLTFEQVNQIIDKTRTPQCVDLKPIQKEIHEIPGKVLISIQNSTNTYKGALGELIGYINLKAAYDRIIPLNSIVDFLCIKLPTEEQEGYVDFVDVKTGNKARLSKEQRALQQLIKDKKINFLQFKVDTNADFSS